MLPSHVYLPQPEGRFLSQGEDLAFSIRARDAGFPIYAVHLPGLRHHKTRALSHDAEAVSREIGEPVDVAG